ncbi:MAG: PAS domain-containing protein [Devosia sp.]
MLPLEGTEKVMGDNDIIVSKTDLKGHVTYANDVFLDMAELTLAQTLGQPHSLIRSRAMPRSVFKLLWDRLESGHEVFAYVVNRTSSGNHYWVLAHVTPSLGPDGKVHGYHSSRRKPNAAAVGKISKVYEALLAAEAGVKNGKQSLAAGFALLLAALKEKGIDYDEYVLTL